MNKFILHMQCGKHYIKKIFTSESSFEDIVIQLCETESKYIAVRSINGVKALIKTEDILSIREIIDYV